LGNPNETRFAQAVVVSKVTRRLLPLLFLLYVVAYVDRINIGFAALQIKSFLNISDGGFGFAAGVFFAGYVLFQLPSNLILERVGARRWIAVLMMVWGLISSCMIFVRAPLQLYALRFLLGSAEAGFFPGIVFYLKGWFPSTGRAKTVALFMAAGPLSAVIAGPLSGSLLRLHRGGLAGWQWMFFLEGMPAALLGLSVLLYLTDTPREAHWLSLAERDWLIETLQQESSGSRSPVPTGGLAEVFASSQIWLLVVIYFGLNCAGYGITFWLPSLIRDLSGVGTVTIGLLSAIPYAAALVVMIVAGAHSDKSGKHRWHVAMPAFLGAIALLSAAYSSSVRGLVAALSIAIVAEFSMSGPFWALSTMIKPRCGAVGIALINSIGNLGGLTGAFVVGALKNTSSGFRGGIIVLGAALGTAGILALLLRSQPNDLGSQEPAAAEITS